MGHRSIVISNNASGSAPNAFVAVQDMSEDGRYTCLSSVASDLVADDTNGASDVFVHDSVTGTTKRVSVASATTRGLRLIPGRQGNGNSDYCVISGDGRYVAFSSTSTNLAPNKGFSRDVSGADTDVYVHDRVYKTTVIANPALFGGRPDGWSHLMDMDASGSKVIFSSNATNLVPYDTNGKTDIFKYDVASGRVARVSVKSDGSEFDKNSKAASISDSGGIVVFKTDAGSSGFADAGYVTLFGMELVSGVLEPVYYPTGWNYSPFLSDRMQMNEVGRFVFFMDQPNNMLEIDETPHSQGNCNWFYDFVETSCESSHIYRADRRLGNVEYVSITSDGLWSWPLSVEDSYDLSRDGAFLLFQANAIVHEDLIRVHRPTLFARDLDREMSARIKPVDEEGNALVTYFDWEGNTRETIWDTYGFYAISGNGCYIAHSACDFGLNCFAYLTPNPLVDEASCPDIYPSGSKSGRTRASREIPKKR